jgi:hypothetical protein
MNSTEELFLCNYCLKVYSNENIRQVKLRAVEFIRNYLDQRLIKCKFLKHSIYSSKFFCFFIVNRICLNCINNYVRNIADQYNQTIILNSKSLDIDYISNSIELNLTLQYIDQNRIPSIRISSRFLSITTIEQIIDYLIQTFDLSVSSNNLILTMIKKENNEIWYPIIYDKSTTLYQLDIKTNNYLRFEFSLENKKTKF